MGDTYGNSTVTIAADSAEDSSKGCFFPRNALGIKPCMAKVFGRFCIIQRHANDVEEIFGKSMTVGLPLHERAWVLQEQILACRTIGFQKDQVHWRCSNLLGVEAHPQGLPGMPHQLQDYRSHLQGIINGTGLYPGLRKTEAYGFWYRSVMDFTTRKLTIPSDKLVAISGIASKMAVSVKDDYIAGLWRSDIHIGLLWVAGGTIGFPMELPARRTETYRAPSWSWASIEGFISYTHVIPSLDVPKEVLKQPLLDIIDYDINQSAVRSLSSQETFAAIRAKGYLLRIRTCGERLVKAKGELVGSEPEYGQQGGQSNSATFFRGLGFFYPDESCDRHSIEGLCAPVASVEQSNWCLILKAEEGERHTYSRIGLGQLDVEGMTEFEGLEGPSATEFTIV
ncbi:uncharacterized protein KY384_000003 [Bacidia gigantensis]|uniref:uncharacterized protein n=1 Tax=Bacidia gigantensis TaxID=2732470 RepID=UPI001D0387BE|nr:uncharacterized protein KY384_000003 [Bacidia gigantensis]KAG8526410.1 hypothetical protein KY384_000003 [Bacidia gigantensis]